MPCHSAMITKPFTVSPEQTVEYTLTLMKENDIAFVPVVEGDGTLVGLFSYGILMKNLLPVSVAMADGVQLDITVRAAPGVAKRLKKVQPLPVSDLMERKFIAVRPETPTWEGINLLVTHGDPLLVVEDENMNFLGLITTSSALEDLQQLKAPGSD